MTDAPPEAAIRLDVARIDVLEERVAHQDAIIEDLNAALTAQWSRLDALMRRLAQLDDRLAESEARAGSAQPQAPPPHY